jgi:hypothetical protein
MIYLFLILIMIGIFLSLWIVGKIKDFKTILIFLILFGLILLSYFSITNFFQKEYIDYKSISGIINGGKMYVSWIFSSADTIKQITMNIVKIDFGKNKLE